MALALSLVLLLPASGALAADDATREIARIVADINHRPDAAAKETLRQIRETGTPAQQTIAESLLEMNHKVSPAAKEKLDSIASDSALPDTTRELAAIVGGINHQASAADKQKLRDMQAD